MKTDRITFGFTRGSDANFEQKCLAIISLMTNNANFVTPAPALNAITSAINDFTAAISAAKSGDRIAITARNQKRAELITMMRTLAAYVTFTANGDKAIMVTAGLLLISTLLTPALWCCPKTLAPLSAKMLAKP